MASVLFITDGDMIYFWVIFFSSIITIFELGGYLSINNSVSEIKVQITTDNAINALYIRHNQILGVTSRDNEVAYTPPEKPDVVSCKLNNDLLSYIEMRVEYNTIIDKYMNSITKDDKRGSKLTKMSSISSNIKGYALLSPLPESVSGIDLCHFIENK